MTTSTVPLFLNPVAGRGRAGKRVDTIIAIFSDADVAVDLRTSSAVGDLEQQVYESCIAGEQKIIVAGGDGSVHEAVNGIMRAGTRTRLGVIPTGTGNDFAKACDIALDWREATRLLARRVNDEDPCRRIDVGRMNDRWFANGAGVGFDAKVTKVARSYRWPIGDFVYLFAIFRCMIDGIATPTLVIRSDELDWDGPVTLTSISNGPWIGGMFHIAPMARNDDGKLELLVAGPVTRRRILALLPKLIRGRHMGEPEVTHAAVRRVTIEASAPIPWHLDGEVGDDESTYELELVPGALHLL